MLLQRTLKDLQSRPTLTERLYIVSPLLLAVLKDASELLGLAARRRRKIARRMAREVADRNSGPSDTDEQLIIRGGPFKGMDYLRFSAGSLLKAKLSGTYENEIGTWFREAIESSLHDVFIDVGCAEGYYAVGMARFSPRAFVYGFDIDPAAQEMTRRLAHANQVDNRVAVDAECTPSILQKLLSNAKTPLMLVDIEGFEDELLDMAACPALSKADIIVELHEHKRPGVTYRLLERFKDTHRTDAIVAVPDEWKLSEALNISENAKKGVTISDVQEGRRLPQMWLRLRSQVR